MWMIPVGNQSDSVGVDVSSEMAGAAVDMGSMECPEPRTADAAPGDVKGVFSGTDLDHMMADPRAMRRTIMALAWPVVAEQVLGTMTQMADMIMVGRLGAAAVAAVGLSNQPLFIVQGLFMGLGVGVTALVARFIGAGDKRRANEVTSQALAITVALGVVLAAVGYLYTPWLVRFMKAGSDVVPFAVGYMGALMPGLFMLAMNMVISAALRGAGDTTFPMKVNILINLSNLFGNYLLIYGHWGFPALGVRGAALATTLSRMLGAGVLTQHILSGQGVVTARSDCKFRFDLKVIARILNVGLPAALERISLCLGLAFYVRIVASLGTAAYAAHAIAINAESISYMPGFAFAVSATTLVGQALGAGRKDVAERSGWESWKISAVIMGLMGIVLFVFPEQLMRLYVDDEEIIKLGAGVLRIMAIAQVPMSAGYTIVGALRGAGDTRAVLYLTIASVWGVRFFLAWLFVNVLGLGLRGAWYAMALDWVARGSISMVRFSSGRWRDMSV
ncbi:MAG: MATE family efflux transporter [Clostridia bacterium]|nr:MATE family efflux transporter [Clostridia bacterium]